MVVYYVDGLELWVDFGVGKNKEFFPIHEMYFAFGAEMAGAIPFFHSFTGCDQNSFLSQVTKNSAWKLWQVFPAVTEAFTKLSDQPSLDVVNDVFPVIERFTVLLYSRTSNALTTDEARRELFCLGRSVDKIPPTSAALFKHVLRASYIAGYYWSQALVASQNLPSPEDWGWKDETGAFIPVWTHLPEATAALRDLIKCGCKNNICKGNCKCIQTGGLPCTELCKCKGQCRR